MQLLSQFQLFLGAKYWVQPEMPVVYPRPGQGGAAVGQLAAGQFLTVSGIETKLNHPVVRIELVFQPAGENGRFPGICGLSGPHTLVVALSVLTGGLDGKLDLALQLLSAQSP